MCIDTGPGVAVGVELGLRVSQGRGSGATSTLALALALPLGPSRAPSLSLALYLRPGGYALPEGLLQAWASLAAQGLAHYLFRSGVQVLSVRSQVKQTWKKP